MSFVAGGIVLLLLVASVLASGGAAVVPPDRRRASTLHGLAGRGDGGPRRPRHPADLRRHRRRPLPRPGLRPGAGPLLRDGLPPARDGRPAVASCSASTTLRDRQVRPHAWAGAGWPSRSCRCSTPTPGSYLRPTPTASTPTWPTSRGAQLSLEYAAARARRARLHARAVDARSTRWPGSRRWRGTCAATWTTRSSRALAAGQRCRAEQIDELYPPLPVRPAPADRRPGRGRRRGLRAGRDERGTRRRPPRRRTAPAGDGAARQAATRRWLDRCRPCSGRTATGSAPTPGSVSGATPRPASRCSPTTRTSAPPMPGDLVPDGPALPQVDARLPVRRRRLHLLRAARRRHRPQRRIAWGFTNLGPDVTDLYLEQVSGDTVPAYDGQRSVPLRRARGDDQGRRADDPVTITVRVHAHGPISPTSSTTSPTSGRNAPVPGRRAADAADGYAVALRWTALQPGRTADAIFALDQASDWDEFRRPRADFDVPAQNLVYADVDGQHRLPGAGPDPDPAHRRRRLAGARLGSGVRLDRATSRSTRCPTCSTPRTGYVVTANQAGRRGPATRTTSADDWDYGLPEPADPRPARAPRPEHHRRRHGADPARHLQRRSPPPWCRTCSTSTCDVASHRQGQRLLRGWDFTQPADSAAAAYFNAVWRNLLRTDASTTSCPESAWPDGGDRWFEVVSALLDKPDDAVVGRHRHPRRRSRRATTSCCRR